MVANDKGDPKQGCEWLKNRVGIQFKTLDTLEVAQTSEVAADNQFLHPIYRTFQQAVIECLPTALDHLRFLAWSLENRDEPFPYAQFTVVRTAITAASTAAWMLNGSDAAERRIRALEFYLKDFKSNAAWMDTVKGQPQLQNLSAADQARADAERAVLETRQDLVVQMANSLLNPQPPLTRKTLDRTSDTKMVSIAGSHCRSRPQHPDRSDHDSAQPPRDRCASGAAFTKDRQFVAPRHLDQFPPHR
jgi:hypothetical protein